MDQTATSAIELGGPVQSRRVLYGLGIIVTLSFLYVANLTNDSRSYVQIYLPLATGSLLVLFFAGVEYTVNQAHALVAHTSEKHAREEAEQLAEERQRTFNLLWQTLADNRHAVQAPPTVLQGLANLFATDLVAVWAADRVGGFHLYGATKLPEERRRRLEKVSQTSPCFEVLREQKHQLCITDIPGQTTKSFAWFCEEMEFRQVVLCPVLVQQNVVGVLGFFYGQKQRLDSRQREEMQLAANLFLCAL
jgi:transcriptional regulator with GAF, ATPase, and Fis domain